VAVDQTRRRRPPVKIDDLRVRADMRANFGVRSDGEKSAVEPDGDSLHHGVVRIDSQNLAAEQDDFGNWSRRPAVRRNFLRTLERRHPDERTDKDCR